MMWQRLHDLLAAAKRPLVVIDFETAGLSGAPPVEFALMYWAPWAPPEMDATSVRARRLCPPGLTYAASWRLDPGCPIHPEATAVHGITDADVRGKARPYNDLELASLFRGLAAGSPQDGEGPAVWVGHNAAEADVPWARSWGYLPADPAVIPVIDTMRVQRRLVKEHPYPLAPDALTHADGPWRDGDGKQWPRGRDAGPGDWQPLRGPIGCNVIHHGLKPYASNLEGLHTALFGDPAEGGHGALADACATARCLAAMLELWSPLWSVTQRDQDSAGDLDRLLAALDAPPPGQLGWDGWLAPRPHGVPVEKLPPILWGKKARKYVGQPLTVDPGYARWVLSLPPSPTGEDGEFGEAWCDERTRSVLEEALGIVRRIG